jgi:hypothetical protein
MNALIRGCDTVLCTHKVDECCERALRQVYPDDPGATPEG